MVAEKNNKLEPTPTNLTKKAIANLARKVADKLDFKPGDPMYDVVKKLGGKIVYIDEWNPLEGESLKVIGESNFTIYIPRVTSPQRDRFTIAHELGHYILHSLFGEDPFPFNRKKNPNDRVEWEANWFAASFLMPKEKFEAEMKIDSSNLHLASVFDVSITAIITRKNSIDEY